MQGIAYWGRLRPHLQYDSISVEDIPMLGDDDLDKIIALLQWMAQDFQSQIKSDDIHIEAIEAYRQDFLRQPVVKATSQRSSNPSTATCGIRSCPL